ncbi:Low molecular weight protein-tyrosine-phosphatase YfkJ [Companilactobacillus paralimentarius]
MKQIIFVCLGNICRSPMAEMMMKQLVAEKGLSEEIQIQSRATSTYEIGNSPHPGAIRELQKQNIPIVEHAAKQITTADFDKADVVIGMDQQNILDLKQMAPVSDQAKVHLAYEIVGKADEVQDPWYDHKFDRTYRQLKELLPLWLDKVISN